ncbi:MAG: hypothetical protein ACRDPW_01575 [Mycobacteriales bacterium]
MHRPAQLKGDGEIEVDSAESAKGRASVTAPTPSGRAKVPPRLVSNPSTVEPVSAMPPPLAAPMSAPAAWQPEPPQREFWNPGVALPPWGAAAASPDGFSQMPALEAEPDQVGMDRSGPGQMPPTLKAASILLGVNLLLTVLAALLSIVISDELIALTLGRDPLPSDQSTVNRLEIIFLVRAWGNVAIALIYAFLIWQLHNGKRGAWRRLVWLSAFGMAGVAYLLFLPYPLLFHIGQLAQILVLFAMFALAVHPQSRGWCQRKTR